jgi:hypothetical protein
MYAEDFAQAGKLLRCFDRGGISAVACNTGQVFTEFRRELQTGQSEIGAIRFAAG